MRDGRDDVFEFTKRPSPSTLIVTLFISRAWTIDIIDIFGNSDRAENADSSDFSEYGFCTFWAFCQTKGAKSPKDRFLQVSERELCTFSTFCSCKVCKMRKVQIPHSVGSSINTERYGSCGFCGGWPDFPINMPFWTDRPLCMLPVRCLSDEKKYGISIHLHNKHFRHNRIPKMLKMFIVHAPASPFGGSRSPADRQPHMLFWCQTCAKSAMGLQAAIAVCKFCAPRFVTAISWSFRNNFSSAVIRSSTSQRTLLSVSCKQRFIAENKSTDRKSTKSILLEIPHNISFAESPARWFLF